MSGLALAKAYHPSFDPAPLVKGFPQYNSDGSQFDKKSYARTVKQTRYVATQIANSLKLNTLQYGYNAANEEVIDDEPQRIDLLKSYKDSIAADKSAPCASTAPSSSTPTVPPPSRAAVEDEDEGYFQPLHLVTWRGDEAPKTRATEAEATEDNPASAKDDITATTASTNPAPEAGA